MAFERFTKEARATVAAAFDEEARSGARGTVEAEHLLLALTAHPDLHGLGLDHAAILAALAHEEERSLASVGIAAGDFDPPPARPGRRSPKLATSAKLALERSVAAAVKRGERRITAAHLLLGVLAAERGRVPRALQIAGIDVDELRSRI